MNVLTEDIGQVVANVKAKLQLTNLNYLYGYLSEVKETLAQDSKTVEFREKKYPLVWLVQPFTLARGNQLGLYGTISNVRMFIINGSDKNWKAKQRMDNNYKPILYPIYDSLIEAFNNHPTFVTIGSEKLRHRVTDRYYWGEDQSQAIDDVFDCMEISDLELKINKNYHCLT